METAQCNPVEGFFLCLHWGFSSTDAYRSDYAEAIYRLMAVTRENSQTLAS
jgi:hypothetical protein